jgi:hypothetical protein
MTASQAERNSVLSNLEFNAMPLEVRGNQEMAILVFVVILWW